MAVLSFFVHFQVTKNGGEQRLSAVFRSVCRADTRRGRMPCPATAGRRRRPVSAPFVLERFPLGTCCTSSHTACRFAEKARFSRSLQAQAALCRRLASSYTFRLKETSMTEYEKTFRRSRSRRGGRSRRDEPPPTLATVDIEEYSRWLADVYEDNLSRVSRRKGERNAGQDDTLREKLAAYCSAVRTLRIALVTLRQKGQGLSF